MSGRFKSGGDEDESNLLAALGSSVQNMDAYEEDVLRSAELESAPKLTGIGFPDLRERGTGISQVPAMERMLKKVRAELQQKGPQNHSPSLLLKQQMLLNLLHSVTNDSGRCVHPQEEFRQEQQRRKQLQQIQPTKSIAISINDEGKMKGKATVADSVPSKSAMKSKKRSRAENDDESSLPLTEGQRLENIKQGKSVRFAHELIERQRQRRRRIGIQPRKNENGDRTEDGRDVQKRKAQLRKLRKHREEVRQRRREQWKDDIKNQDDDEENEFEFDDTNIKQEEKESGTVNGLSSANAESKQSESTGQLSTTKSPRPQDIPQSREVQCPLCRETLSISDPNTNLDEFLSHHMVQCQSARTRGQRRSSRTVKRENIENHQSATSVEEVKPIQENESTAGIKKEEVYGEDSDDEEVEYDMFENENEEEDDILEVDEISDDDVKPKKNLRQLAPLRSSRALDDWDEDDYEDRVYDWIEGGIQNMKIMKERDANEKPPGEAYYDGGLVVPAWVNNRLFPYQRTALEWMWELHSQQAGGIVGDEMGLGKTVQICAFLGSMAASRKLKSVLIIAPATMLQHWLKELEKWAPGLRRILIHQSADTEGRAISFPLLNYVSQWLKTSRKERLFEPIDEEDLETRDPASFCGTAYTFVTTFENVRRNPDVWTNHNWSYIVMDEAQKIRNPDADVTLVSKVRLLNTAFSLGCGTFLIHFPHFHRD